MKKRGFLSVYVLLILVLLSISLSFIYKQAVNNQDSNKDIYNRKKAIYKEESIYSIIFDDKENLIKILEEVDKINDHSWHDYNIKYFNQIEKFRCKKISDTYFSINSVNEIGDSRAELQVLLYLKEKYELKEEEKIILADKFDEFYKNIKFKTKKFKEYENYQMENDSENTFLKINKNLNIKDKKEKSNEISDEKNQEKNDSNLKNKEENYSNKSKAPIRISGIVIIGNDLILENDLILDGLLIIKGDIISKNKSKLIINGQIISENDYSNLVKYSYDKDKALNYINDIENPKYIEIKSKKVF
ncbi:hypothetical protein [Anaerococcus hydrogenalis]|uniref:Uncharacterized protein n=1 Tax=Anaerococcus hydrogenalis ACS-025-V-Sch4 TaxID=879306 RepID=F0H281_9FIRM|nr:hypothetical protein [Anaerococcus hydrogenalis]EGC83428.1 hypothetical protein HMPREF9246_0240 [Anaerococcus hydrogenalis ACS-025-V-Sch4]